MSEAEKLLADVPAQDPHFVLGVMARIEQRRFRRELVLTMGFCTMAILLLALVMPVLTSALSGSFTLLRNDGVVGTLLLVFTVAGPRLFAARD